MKDFNYLFVAGHYQIKDAKGEYDAALVKNLLPKLKKYKVQAYLQGHRHTMEHNQGTLFESENKNSNFRKIGNITI